VRYEIEVNGRLRQVTIDRADGGFTVIVDGKEYALDVVRAADHTLSLLIKTSVQGRIRLKSYEVSLAPDPVTGGLRVGIGGAHLPATINGRRRWGQRDGGGPAAAGPQRIVAPMPGRIARVLVKKGDPVLARQPVVVIEAMKMENELRASAEGTLAEIHVQDGQSVEAGALLAVIHR
jgi:acetyl/propionyl-CoA carboxylase alpha subunit